MTYNPVKHHRRSIRLKGYDYSKAGLYFVTICCQDRICRFGDIKVEDHCSNPEMVLNEYGQIAYNEWAKLPERFPNVELDVFQIMPNHIHGIITLAGATLAVAHIDTIAQNNPVAQNETEAGATARVAPTLSGIVGAYKSLVTIECLKIFKYKNETMGKLWQRNYYEHIIRDERTYMKISEYIINNPANWGKDSLK